MTSIQAVPLLLLATASFAIAKAKPITTALNDELAVNLPVQIVEGKSTSAAQYQLPQTTESVTAQRIEESVNIVDSEDALKYLPSLFVRKRNNGDTQAVLATRVWGVSSSARSLIYADGVLLSALIANNNSIGGPRWGLVAPEEIERVDVLYGPYAAAYAGNSMGAVVEIYTKQPDSLVASLSQTEAWQHFSQYGTKDDYFSHQTSATAGNRNGRFSFWVSGNFQDSHSQPLSFITNTMIPPGTTGGYAAANKLGQPAPVLGAGGLLHTRMVNGKLKAAYDFTKWLRLAYTFGLWRNDGSAEVDTYLRDASGAPTYAGLNGFASSRYEIEQQHTAHSLTLRSDTQGCFDFELIGSRYKFDRDRQNTPANALVSGTTFSQNGRVAVLEGTGWQTLDAKAVWRSATNGGAHSLSFGAHEDRYELRNPTYTTADWLTGETYTGIATQGNGKTRTQALWAQEAWRVTPVLKITLGARYENWRAYDGYNRSGATTIVQPGVSASHVSPKVTVAWDLSPGWTVSASAGKAYRFATASELYQLVSTGATFTSPNPELKPDNVESKELRLERTTDAGRLRLSLFQDDIRDAIISQFKPLVAGSTMLYQYLSNVDQVRARGVELALERTNILAQGLDVSGSVTYVDAEVRASSGRASATAAPDAVIGKRLPNIPEWRTTFLVTYRFGRDWTFSAGGRYSSLLYTTLDNTDVNPNTYQGFSSWFVADLRALYRIGDRWSLSLGIDNVLNREYFLFHPFPQRTVVLSAKYNF